MLSVELLRHDLENRFPWPSNQVCTVEASYPIKNKRIKLGDLYSMATGKELKNSHRAKGDTLGLIEVILFLKENGFINATNC
jgi:uncharacterized protein YrrD